jgi:hypothetical protein
MGLEDLLAGLGHFSLVLSQAVAAPAGHDSRAQFLKVALAGGTLLGSLANAILYGADTRGKLPGE